MSDRCRWVVFPLLIISFLLFSCQNHGEDREAETLHSHKQLIGEEKRSWDKQEETSQKPNEWGEQVTGVYHRMATDEKVIALTFDACGGPQGDQYDEDLVEFLIENRIKASLFINKRWAEQNPEKTKELADNPLFRIENHGTDHVPLSVSGQTAWGIQGTQSEEEVLNEVGEAQKELTQLTGEPPVFFRSGTAYYDEVAVAIVEEAGLEVLGFDVAGDAGATYSAEEVKKALLDSRPGSIPLLHMNQPGSGTAEGVKKAVPKLLEEGYEFVHPHDYPLHRQ